MSINLNIRNITYSLCQKRVLSYVDYTFLTGITYIVGPSGAGKSTLFNLITKSLFPTTGDIFFCGTSIYSLETDFYLNRYISIVKQDAFISLYFSLHDYLIILDKINDPLVTHYLSLLGIENLLHSVISLCSGGERHRIAIFLALLKNTPLLLLDEPTANLDDKNKEIFYHLMCSLPKKIILIITHDHHSIKHTNVNLYEIL